MFNQGNNGLDLINHAIRMGTVGEVFRRNDLLRQLNNQNPGFVSLPGNQSAQQPADAQATVQLQASQQQQQQQQQAAAARTGAERLNPNAFQFPWKLHDMLDSAVADGFSSVVSWQDDGRSFRVHNPQEFVDSVMPIYFKQTKYKSFQRQLNLYGFSRINEGPTKGGYKHQYFIRGQRNHCQLITRNSTGEAHGANESGTNSTQVARACPASPANSTHESSSNHHQPLHQDVHNEANVTANPTATIGSTIAPRIASTSDITPKGPGSSGDANHYSSSAGNSTEEKTEDSKTNKEFQFPWKLYEMLEKSETDAFEYIVSWQPDFASFKVHDPHQFVNSIMPRFFKQTKYKSFQRQLNLYGFTRIEDGPSKGSYRHPCFVKGQKDLLSHLSRQKMRNGPPGATPRHPSFDISYEYSADAKSSVSRYEDAPTLYDGVPAALEAIKKSEGVVGAPVKIEGVDAKEASASKQSLQDLSWRQGPAESFSDWVIEVVENESNTKQSYCVHRRVLATGPRRSKRIEKQFKNLDFSNTLVLELGPDEASVFPMLLDHIYADPELNLDAERSYALYLVAERLEVSSALHVVTDFYCKMMNKENLFDFVTLAKNFKDKTLLEATISKYAEELRSLEQTSVSKLEPDVLLQVMLKNKTLQKNYKCGSNKLSQFVAECAQAHRQTLTQSSLYALADKEHLPYIEPIAAIKLLATETRLLTGSTESFQIESFSLRERCVDSIARNWQRLRGDIEESPVISSQMKSIDSGLLFKILLKATETTEVSV